MEARIVHAADKVQLFVKVNQYHAAGFTGVDRFWKNAASGDDCGLPEARALLDRLAEHHADGTWPVGDQQ
jgi:hypothetical protein